MHFAICFWGLFRSVAYTVSSISQNCLDPITNAGHTYEIFIHTYKFSGTYVNTRNNEEGAHLNFSEWKILNPDHIFVEDQDDFDNSVGYDEYKSKGDPWKNNYASFRNHLRALNSLNYLAIQVEKQSRLKKFDGVVYLRPDLTYLNELPFYLLEFIPNTLFVADFHRSCKGGEYNDRMAMGDVLSGITYGKKFQAALEYSKSQPLHSEKFTYNYLRANNVSVKEMPFRFRRTRVNGNFHVRDAVAIQAPQLVETQKHFKTWYGLRLIYDILEYATNHKRYIWNHEDGHNLYCSPNPKITLKECNTYRDASLATSLSLLQQQNQLETQQQQLSLLHQHLRSHPRNGRFNKTQKLLRDPQSLQHQTLSTGKVQL